MTELVKQLQSVDAQLEQKRSDVSSLDAKISLKKEELEQLAPRIQSLEERAKLLADANQKSVDGAELKLKDIYLKTEKALKLLKETRDSEKQMRENIAERTLALDRREEVIRRKESLLSDAEYRAAELRKYMKL